MTHPRGEWRISVWVSVYWVEAEIRTGTGGWRRYIVSMRDGLDEGGLTRLAGVYGTVRRRIED